MYQRSKEKKFMSPLKVGGPGAEFSFLSMCRSSWNCFYVSPTQIGTMMSKVFVNVISSIGEEQGPTSTIAIKPNTIDFHGTPCDVRLNQDLSAALWYPEALIIKLCV